MKTNKKDEMNEAEQILSRCIVGYLAQQHSYDLSERIKRGFCAKKLREQKELSTT